MFFSTFFFLLTQRNVNYFVSFQISARFVGAPQCDATCCAVNADLSHSQFQQELMLHVFISAVAPEYAATSFVVILSVYQYFMQQIW